MQDFGNINSNFDMEEDVNYRKIVAIALKNWYLFLIFGFLGLFVSYLVVNYSQQNYKINATIYVPKNNAGMSGGLSDLFANQMGGTTILVFNQIEILKSFTINQQSVQKLNWKTNWYQRDKFSLNNFSIKKSIFKWNAYYKDLPFLLEEKEGSENLKGIKLYVNPLNETQYQLKVEGDATFNGQSILVDIDAVANYGELFENDYFHFTLTPKQKDIELRDLEFYFVFNKASSLARSYSNRLSVSLKEKQSEIVLLELTGTQPKKEVDYLNTLIAVYMQYKMDLQTETYKSSLAFIDSQLVGISDSLTLAGDNFSQYREENQIIDIGVQGVQVLSSIVNLDVEMIKTQRQLDYFNNLLDYINKANDLNNIVAPSVVGIADPSFNALVANISALYSRRQILAFSAKDNNPALVMINQEIVQKRDLLKENLRNLINNTELLQGSLKKQKKEMAVQLTRLPEKERSLINFQRRFDMTNEIYTFLLQKRAEIDITLAGTSPDVQVIDAARMETILPVGSSNRIKLFLGLFFGLAFPVLYLIVYHYFSNTIESQEDIERNTSLAILGNVIHSRDISETPVYDNPRSGIAESYRGIRTNLQFMISGEDKKVIAIHSTHPSEGKSFTAINLASILAMNNKKVVLIGGDLRKPRLHKIFNLKNEHGISTYLIGQDKLKDIIFKTKIERLSFLPSGPIPPNPSELLDTPEMGTLIESLKAEYDFIIIDNAPVALVTDGLLVGRHVDLNIFILRYGFSRKDRIKMINQMVENKVLNHVALIVNDIKTSAFGYGPNYYYSDNYKGYYAETEEESWYQKLIKKLKR